MPPTIALYSAVIVCSLSAFCPPTAQAQKITPRASQGGVSWQVDTPNNGISLRVSQPDGTVFEQRFARGQSPAFTQPAGVLPDGSYTYELRLAPIVSKESQAQANATEIGDEGPASFSASVQSGSFRVVGGMVRLPNASAVESERSPAVPEDTFTDVIIQDVSPRLRFDDTSGAGFSSNDWELEANGASGSTDRFSVRDVTGATTPFTIRGGAPNDSLVVSTFGRIGLGTVVPAQNLHIVGTFPSIRLDQQIASPRVWDIRGNNSNGFIIEDVTAGTLPFLIKAGTGNVGIGTLSPAGRLHVNGAGAQLSIFQSSDNNAVQFRLQTNSTNRRFVALNTAARSNRNYSSVTMARSISSGRRRLMCG